MASLPPLPHGFVLEDEPPPTGFRAGDDARGRHGRPDPFDIALDAGFQVTNGFRTQADMVRLRRAGYNPAPNSAHLRGDAMDLVHPRMTPRQMVDWARQNIPNGRPLYHDRHLHLTVPGWGAAPGTPGSRNSGLPALPPGFELEQRGSLAGVHWDQSPSPEAQSEAPAWQPMAEAAQPPAPPWQPMGQGSRPRVPGNIDLGSRPVVRNPEGTVSTLRSMSFGTDDGEVLIPTMADDGRQLSEQEAIDLYRQTGRHLGIFGTPEEATAFARSLSDQQGTRVAAQPATQPRTLPQAPAGTEVAFAMDGAAPDEPVGLSAASRQALGEMEAAFDGGASRAALLAIARRHGVLTPEVIGQLDTALRWRARNPDALGRVGTFVQGPAARPQGEWRAHEPNAAERIGQGFGSLVGAVEGALGREPNRHHQAEQARNMTDLLDWTMVGDYDAARAYQEAEIRAHMEGRPLDALGNSLGANVSAAGMIPIVGPALSRLRRAGEAAVDGGRRLLGRGVSPVGEDAARFADETAEALPGLPPPERTVDRIDVRDIPPPPPGFQLEPQIGRVQPLGEQPSPVEMADVARGIRPADVTPIPANRIESEEEAIRANPGSVQDVAIPDERAIRQPRTVQTFATGAPLAWRGPVDAETFLRSRGGLRDDGGNLTALGITDNAARSNVPRDRFVGPIRNAEGMGLDDARELLAEAGFIDPEARADEVLEVLRAGRNGQPVYRADDMAEAAAVASARSQRWTAEQAAAEGAPIAQRVGEPVDMADLDANAPPATAYEELPRIGGTVGNINLAHVESGSDIRRLLQNVEDRFGGFDAARRGVITHAETRALADELGMTADDLLRRRRGQALNAEQALASRQLLARSSDEVVRLAERARGPEASDVSRTAFSEALLRHAAIHEQVTGATAEAGRALQAFRMAARSRAVSDRIHQAATDGMGGQQRLEEIAEGILTLQRQGGGPGSVNRFAVDALRPRLRDKLVELWYNSLLSGPQTHVVNTLSNAMTQALQIPEQIVASGIGQVRRGVRAARGLDDDFDRVLASEVGPRMVGLMQGAREGVAAFGRTLRTGDVPDFVTKVEARTQRAISGLKGEVVRIPSRLLAAEDEFFKATARRMELNGLAVRQARSEGLRGQAMRDRIADLSANPTDAMLERALDTARYLTFQRPLQGFPSDLSRLTQRQPWMKLFLPFIRTPTNIFKFAVARSPFAPVLREVRQDLAAGGEKQALAVARMALGTGLGMLIAQWAEDGTITGGAPRNRNHRDMLTADGWQPYSIRLGNTYYSYQRLDPLAMTLGTAANMAGAIRSARQGDLTNMGAQLISSVIGNLSDKTWLSGVSDLMGALDDPDRNLNSFLSRMAGSVAVPTGVAQVARWNDPTLRDTRGNGLAESALRRIQSRIPGLSDNLPARRDVLGREVVSGGGLGPDLVSPIWTNEARNDPMLAEMRRLDVNIGRPSRRAAGGQYNSFDYDRLQESAGRYTADDLRAVMATPRWQAMDDDGRRREVRRVIDRSRRDARRDLYTPIDAPRGAGAMAPGVSSRSDSIPPPPAGFALE